MDSMDNFCEQFEALEQQTEQWQQHTRMVERGVPWSMRLLVATLVVSALAAVHLGQAADFACAAGDAACLIDAINTANANGEVNTITLEAGTYTLTASRLPLVTSTLTIQGAGIDTTVIERDPSAPNFSLVGIGATGVLTLDGLTLRGGRMLLVEGGGLVNGGTLTITHTRVTGNSGFGCGGLFNQGGTVAIAQSLFTGNSAGIEFGGGLCNFGGTVTITQTTFAHNGAGDLGGGLINSGTVILVDSTLVDNNAGGGGGVANLGGTAILINSTIARNVAVPFRLNGVGGGLCNGGTAILINSTIADNRAERGGGLVNGGCITAPTSGTATLTNTILARNTDAFGSPDCQGLVTSLGHNLIGDPTGCTIPLQPSDLTGDPGLGAFTDNGTPGNGHFPLRRGSQAIDAGNDAFCPPTDQLGRRRVNIPRVGTSICDIGAIEFRLLDVDLAKESD